MTKKNKNKINFQSEESLEIKQFAKVLGVVILVIVLFYLFTRIFITKDLFKKYDLTDHTTEEIKIDYSMAVIGTVFNRPYTEYYVILYDSTNVANDYYSVILSAYSKKEDSTKIYFVDLSNPFNSPYIKEESNPKATSAEELAVKDGTLIKIKNGKINKYIEDKETIAEELKV